MLTAGSKVTYFKREGRWACGKFQAEVIALKGKTQAVIKLESGETKTVSLENLQKAKQ